MQQFQANISKLSSELQTPVQYYLPIGTQKIALNAALGKEISLHFTGVINCIACGRVIKKSFNQGYCFPCLQSLAACDRCIIRPELCHFAAGTCRESEWGLVHCMQPHIVYLANTSGLKIGITRERQVPTRWIDQGAIQALPLYRVQSRLQSGIVEVAFKQKVGDKTNWRKMLSDKVEPLNLLAEREQLLADPHSLLKVFTEHFQASDLEFLKEAHVINIDYPVLALPPKINALNLDKTPTIKGTLLGIKGQYLLLDTGVLNIRKYTGYELQVTLAASTEEL